MAVHVHKCTGHKHTDVPPRHTSPVQAEPLSAMGGDKGERGSPETSMLCFSGKIYIKPPIYRFSQFRDINCAHIVA